MTASLDHVNGRPVDPFTEPRFDPIALAKAEAIRTQAEAEANALRIKAEGEAKAAQLVGEQEAEKLRLQNARASMKTEAERAQHEERMARLEASKADAQVATERAQRAAAEEADRAAAEEQEERRAQTAWKWAARGIYAAGMALAAPIQFLAFWDPERKFMVSAPILLEGLALALAAGAAWAVATRRDVQPFRIGIVIAAMIAATINVWHGLTDASIGVNAGIIGGIASLAGPCVLMAYEHGLAQKRDGIPSFRERRDEDRRAKAEHAKAERAAAEKKAVEGVKAAEKRAAEGAAATEQARRDADRQKAHPEVWAIAEAMRSARGLPFVTEAIWSEAWYRVTGSKVVGVTPEMEAQSKAAQVRMKTASEMPILGDFSQVESQKGPRVDEGDGRRSNGGTPPRRVPGDTQPISPIARKQAVLEQTTRKPSEEQS
ncbi:hypothetical protein ACFV0B_11360 [Streptomyces xanthophaeus]|uniref:hypothetical protein n=1 Tax=Streptomyces xanthophaeus TaxID=67385 RepID=UPI0036B7045F